MSQKHYVLDTNVLVDNPDAVKILTNGEDGKDKNQVYITQTVINELDGLKKDGKLSPQIREIVTNLLSGKDSVEVIGRFDSGYNNDNRLIQEVVDNTPPGCEPILVTSDKMLRFKAEKQGITTQEFTTSKPFKSESEKFTGFVDSVELYDGVTPNCFTFIDGKLHKCRPHQDPISIPEQSVWKVQPRTAYQSAAINMILDDSIDVVSIQSPAGLGKSLISLACALQLMLQEKKYKKIYVFKSTEEAGKALGFLPGSIADKLDPYFKNVRDLLMELHELRPANRLFTESETGGLVFNDRFIEFMPINYIRGMTISQSLVIIEEAQNYSSYEMKSILLRMGENVKCIVNGDVQQCDNPNLNTNNNGLNWVVRNFKGQSNYGHITLSGSKSRGPIADLTIKCWK